MSERVYPLVLNEENVQVPVSIIVPNYNYARYLPARLESIANQNFPNFEIILLDDASTDGSGALLEEFAAKEPRVSCVVVNERNSGSPFLQWEKGISLAKGKYIWIAEADDVAYPSLLSELVGALDSNPEASLAFGMSDLIDGEGNPSLHPAIEEYEADGQVCVYAGDTFAGRRMIKKNRVYNASMALFRRSDYLAGHNTTFTRMRSSGDWYFWSKLMTGKKVVEVRKKLNAFRLHPSSTTRKADASARQMFEDALTVIEIITDHRDNVDVNYVCHRLYRILRDLRWGRFKFDCHWCDPEELIETKLNNLGIRRSSFWKLWLNEHFNLFK